MTTADVARLLGRVAFGATAADLDMWTGKPYADLVERLLQPATLPVPLPQPDDAQRVALENGVPNDPAEARRWWLERMRTTPHPLLERMTLVWHGHFATGVRTPPTTAHLVVQNQTLRTHALGDFRALVAAMNVDPAMLLWLNGNENAIPKANENYAREFFELFTLGKAPQVYTEKDVRQAARSFTGWIVNGANAAQFVPARHDPKNKKVLGRTIADQGAAEHKTLVDVALAQPVAATFIARKLVANLVYVPAARDGLVDAVAAELRKSWDIAGALRVLLLSDLFRYAAPAMGRQLVRTPVEAMVHAAKALGVAFDDKALVWPLDRMGHSLFDPVDVSGWPLGRDWITPVTALARYDAGLQLHYLASIEALAAANPLPAPNDLAGWARRLGVAGFGPNTTNAVNGYLRRTATSSPAEQQAGVLTLLLSSPEWVVF